MKNIILYALVAMLVSGTAINVQAQGRKHSEKYWKHQKEAAKKREKYVRERDKKRAKYVQQRRKDAEKYYKEASKRRHKYYKEYNKQLRKHGPPVWAKAHGYHKQYHVYFRDYRTFYDPYRDGYVYRRNGGWVFSAQVPSFMLNVDLGRANIRILKNIPISRRPEAFYYEYQQDYWDE